MYIGIDLGSVLVSATFMYSVDIEPAFLLIGQVILYETSEHSSPCDRSLSFV